MMDEGLDYLLKQLFCCQECDGDITVTDYDDNMVSGDCHSCGAKWRYTIAIEETE